MTVRYTACLGLGTNVCVKYLGRFHISEMYGFFSFYIFTAPIPTYILVIITYTPETIVFIYKHQNL